MLMGYRQKCLLAIEGAGGRAGCTGAPGLVRGARPRQPTPEHILRSHLRDRSGPGGIEDILGAEQIIQLPVGRVLGGNVLPHPVAV